MSKFFVYVIRSKINGYFYVGLTHNVAKRILQHNKGMTKSTKAYRPWDLFFYDECETLAEARNHEKYLKSGIGKEYIKKKWFGSSVG